MEVCKGQSFDFKTKVTALFPFGLVSLLYLPFVLLPLGSNHLPNTGAGLSSAWHMGSVPSDKLATAPVNHHSGATLGALHHDSVGQAYAPSYTEVRGWAQACLRRLPSQWEVWSGRGLPITWGRAGVRKLVFIPWKEGQVKA